MISLDGNLLRNAVCLGAVLGCTTLQSHASESEAFIEEIVVEANRRQENLLDVPLTMTALTDELIRRLGIVNNDDLEQLVPGLQFGDENDKEGQGTVIRGIGTRLYGRTQADLAVAYYVDGVYTSALYGVAPNMFDVERIEVARGPQGTLHGRNSIAGAISYYTKRPTDYWDSDFQVELTDQFSQRYNLAFGGPINDNFSFRLTGGYHDGDGTQKNEGLGDDYDAPHNYYYAPQLRFKNDRVDLNLRYAKVEDTGVPRTSITLLGFPTDQQFDSDGNPHPWHLYREPNPAIANCPSDTSGNDCDELENKVRVNRDGFRDSTRESWTFRADFVLNDNFNLRYTYGKGETDETHATDYDKYNRVAGWEGTNWAHLASVYDQWWIDLPGTMIIEKVDGIEGARRVIPPPGLFDPFTFAPVSEQLFTHDRNVLSADSGTSLRDVRTTTPFLTDEESHEILLMSNFDGPMNFILGAFHYENSLHYGRNTDDFAGAWRFLDAEVAWPFVQALSPWNWFPPFFGNEPFVTCNDFAAAIEANWLPAGQSIHCAVGNDHTDYGTFNTSTESETRAVFGSVDYQINDQWSMSAGLRWTEDDKRQLENRGTFVFQISGIPFRGSFATADNQQNSWDQTIGNISVNYRPSDNTMYYGRVSTGYRAGGFHNFAL